MSKIKPVTLLNFVCLPRGSPAALKRLYGVLRAHFLIKPLASPPLGGIRQWYRYLFSSVAAALLSLLSKNALPECSAGVSRAVNKVFTAQCERFSCGKKAVNFEYMSIRFRNTNWLLLERHLREMKCLLQISTHRSVVREQHPATEQQPSSPASSVFSATVFFANCASWGGRRLRSGNRAGQSEMCIYSIFSARRKPES